MNSIEWLIENLGEYFPHEVGGIHYLVEQAQEMHKQEIIDAVDIPKSERWFDASKYNSAGEQYYNKTYKKD